MNVVSFDLLDVKKILERKKDNDGDGEKEERIIVGGAFSFHKICHRY